jgi:hypothetical protein
VARCACQDEPVRLVLKLPLSPGGCHWASERLDRGIQSDRIRIPAGGPGGSRTSTAFAAVLQFGEHLFAVVRDGSPHHAPQRAERSLDLIFEPHTAEDGFWSDQSEMAHPVRVEATDHQPEESIPDLDVGSRARTEGDLELVAQEQVLDQKVVALPEELCQNGAGKCWSTSNILAGSPIPPDPILPSFRTIGCGFISAGGRNIRRSTLRMRGPFACRGAQSGCGLERSQPAARNVGWGHAAASRNHCELRTG